MTPPTITSPRSAYAAKLREFPDFVFSEQGVFTHRDRWREFFSDRVGPAFDGRIIFEVGCFDADYLSRIAVKYPTTGLVGLDWKCKPLYNGALRIAEKGIKNVALLRGRGQDITRIFSDDEVDEIWVFHPDPCDRPAELKNRLVATAFLNDVHHVLRDCSSRLCLKTDHFGYHLSVKALFSQDSSSSGDLRRQFEITVDSTNYWQDQRAQLSTACRYFAGEITTFENRFLKKRKPIHYFELRKK